MFFMLPRGVFRAVLLIISFEYFAAAQPPFRDVRALPQIVPPARAQVLPKTAWAAGQYIVILADAPVADQFSGRAQLATAAAGGYRTQVEARQRLVTRDLESRNFRVTGSVSTLLNALFVAAPPERADELKSIPGVIAVRPVRRGQRHTNKAVQLANGPAAWGAAAIGGQSNAGKGMKIAVMDTGIDQTHPAFQDSSLTIPAGFPKCNAQSDCQNFTNNKVIVARSYVPWIAHADPDKIDPTTSNPDDYSALDRIGHGTAVASVAAGNTNTGSITFNGMAPKAWLGSYKVYGSPGVNDFPPETVWIKAINDVVNDGMDVVVFSSGLPATSGALDVGALCGLAANAECDPLASAFERAARAGLIIAASAGNNGESGWLEYPNFASVSSPAISPSVLAVGATTSSHVMVPTVSIANAGAPANLRNIPAVLGDSISILYYGSVAISETAPIVDVAALGNDGLACAALPAFSLYNSYALILRGTCDFAVKVANAEAAGAVGVIIYMADAAPPFGPAGVDQFIGNVVMISNADGLALKAYLEANPGRFITTDLAGAEQDVAVYGASLGLTPALAPNQLASFSSQGPAAGTNAIKPDLVATGGLDVTLFLRPEWPLETLPVAPGMYMAAQRVDPDGGLFSPSGYIAADGTSFAAPLVGGAAALVKQARPTMTAAEIRSALVNTSAADVKVDDFGTTVDTQWIGAGRLDAGAAVATTVTSVPSNISFGALKAGAALPQPITLTIKNHSAASVTLTATVTQDKPVTGIAVTVDKASLSLAAGATGALVATLAGTVPAPGTYTGTVELRGAGSPIHIPYMFLVGTGAPFNIPLILGSGEGIAGTSMGSWAVAITDAVGVAVEGSSVTFTVAPVGAVTFKSVAGKPECSPGESTSTIACRTDAYGVAWVDLLLGPNPGSPTVTVRAAGTPFRLGIRSRVPPAVPDGGVLAAANVDSGTAVAPGSYVAIYGVGLSDYTVANPYTTLPLSLLDVTVSFDVPSAKLSLPARITYISGSQVNVQVPWELQGQTSAQVKVTIGEDVHGNVVTVPISDIAPAFYHAAADALDDSYKVITAANPVKRGGVAQLYMNGLGPVSNQPASGAPASGTTLSNTRTTPVVTIGGAPAQVLFSGLAPGFPGLYQVNVIVPQGATTGPSVPVTVTIGGKAAKEATLPVQ